MGRKEKKFPENFFFCLPDHESTMLGLEQIILIRELLSSLLLRFLPGHGGRNGVSVWELPYWL